MKDISAPKSRYVPTVRKRSWFFKKFPLSNENNVSVRESYHFVDLVDLM